MMLCASVRYSVLQSYIRIHTYIHICRNMCTYIYIQDAHLFSDRSMGTTSGCTSWGGVFQCVLKSVAMCCIVLQRAEVLRTHAAMARSR